MKERPILFSAPMVRAILVGAKTQTRRAIKRIPWRPGANPEFSQARAFVNAGEWRIAGSDELSTGFRCPYGQLGDRLWVRETWGIDPCPNMPFAGPRSPEGGEVMYRATDGWDGPWHPSIHMFRWASRVTLEVTDVRVQRLQQCTEADAIAEGCPGGHSSIPGYGYAATPIEQYMALWDSINGAGAWATNPFVWALTFKRVQ